MLLVQWYRHWHVQCTNTIKIYTIILQKKHSWSEVTIKPIIHSSIHSISKNHHYSQKENWVKELLATNKEKNPNLNPPHPHFVGYYDMLKMTTIKGPWISWNAMTIMTTEAFNFKQNSNAWKNNSATMRLELLCTNLHK